MHSPKALGTTYLIGDTGIAFKLETLPIHNLEWYLDKTDYEWN